MVDEKKSRMIRSRQQHTQKTDSSDPAILNQVLVFQLGDTVMETQLYARM